MMTGKFYRVAGQPIAPKCAKGLIKASQRGPVLITRDGRPHGVILSDAEYRRLLANEAQSLALSALSGAFTHE